MMWYEGTSHHPELSSCWAESAARHFLPIADQPRRLRAIAGKTNTMPLLRSRRMVHCLAYDSLCLLVSSKICILRVVTCMEYWTECDVSVIGLQARWQWQIVACQLDAVLQCSLKLFLVAPAQALEEMHHRST